MTMNHTKSTGLLRFSDDGTFRVLQIADAQQSAKVSADTIRLIDALVEASRPDLVVYTGDQTKGYARSFRTDTVRRVRETFLAITEPIRRRGIPFTVTFGNHDGQLRLSRSSQRSLYTGLPGCLMPSNGPDPGTFVLNVRSSDNARDALAIYMVDSGDGTGGRYRPVLPRQIEWLQDTHRRICAKNSRPVPGIVFQHIPVPEFYDLLIKLPCWQPHAVVGIGRRKGCFVLNRQLCRPGGILADAPAIPQENSGEYEALCQTCGIFALFCGHDHRNTFSGKIDGIEMGYSPSCSFDAYGAGADRGGRLFVFHEESPPDFDTHVFTYHDLIGRKPFRPLRNTIDSAIPANTEDVLNSALGVLIGICGIIGAVYLLKRFKKRRTNPGGDRAGV